MRVSRKPRADRSRSGTTACRTERSAFISCRTRGSHPTRSHCGPNLILVKFQACPASLLLLLCHDRAITFVQPPPRLTQQSPFWASCSCGRRSPDSLIRVSRRAAYSHYASILADARTSTSRVEPGQGFVPRRLQSYPR